MNSKREDTLLPWDQKFQGELWFGPTLQTEWNRWETLELGRGRVCVTGWKDSGPKWLRDALLWVKLDAATLPREHLCPGLRCPVYRTVGYPLRGVQWFPACLPLAWVYVLDILPPWAAKEPRSGNFSWDATSKESFPWVSPRGQIFPAWPRKRSPSCLFLWTRHLPIHLLDNDAS